MRALLIATTAALALGVLAGCGNEPARTASDASGQSEQSSQSQKPAPETPSVIAEPTPPASGGKPQDPSGGEPPVTIGPDGPVVPAGVTEVPADQVDVSALPNYFEYGDKVWMFNDGFALQMFAAASSGCSDAEATVVDQSADSVKILVRPLDGPEGGRPDGTACTAVMTPRPVTVTLDTPLRDRTVYLSAGR